MFVILNFMVDDLICGIIYNLVLTKKDKRKIDRKKEWKRKKGKER